MKKIALAVCMVIGLTGMLTAQEKMADNNTKNKLAPQSGEALKSGTPLQSAMSPEPVAHWTFDEGQGTSVLDCAAKRNDTVVNPHWMPGVSGKALIFDGETTSVRRPAEQAPKLSGPFTIEAWIAIKSYPWSWCAIAEQTENNTDGYSFGVDGKGHFGLKLMSGGKQKILLSEAVLPLRTWAHTACVYDEADGMVLYMNGKEAGRLAVSGAVKFTPEQDFVIGRGFLKGNFPYNYSLEGALDELKIYNRALSAEEIGAQFAKAQAPKSEVMRLPVLPSGPPGAGPFGAFYTRLDYDEPWDALWRMGSYPDVLVRFDDSPIRYVFWHGTSYAPVRVTENGIWYSDEWCETLDRAFRQTKGATEPIFDKQCRYSHVRILESNEARTVIHWRYAMSYLDYKIVFEDPVSGWGDWVDEYYAIYPDGVAVRKVVYYSAQPRKTECQESIVIIQPGSKPSDCVQPEAITLANMRGETETYSWLPDSRTTDSLKEADKPNGANIQMVNLKSQFKPFSIFPPPVIRLKFARNTKQENGELFRWYNHWPVAKVPLGVRHTSCADRPAHLSFTNFAWNTAAEDPGHSQTWLMLQGMTDKKIETVLPLARSWITPPKLELSGQSAVENKGYDSAERAYVLSCSRAPQTLEFSVQASPESPLVNPAFVIKGWGNSPVSLKLDGKEIPRGKDFRVAHNATLDGTDLIVWLRLESASPVRLSFQTATHAKTVISDKEKQLSEMSVWFDKPATSFYESTVLGNGRLGAMDCGGIINQRIILNESSMWSGGPFDDNKKDAYKSLPNIKEYLMSEDYAKASKLIQDTFINENKCPKKDIASTFGSYGTLGELIVGPIGEASRKRDKDDRLTNVSSPILVRQIRKMPFEQAPLDYRRELDLLKGAALTNFTLDGVKISRELVVSKPDEVMAMLIKADKPGALSFDAFILREECAVAKSDGITQWLEGQLRFDKPGGGGEGVRFLVILGVRAQGGTVSVTEKGVTVKGADEVMLVVSAGADLRNPDYATLTRKRLAAAMEKPFYEIRDAAVADHHRYMSRCKLKLPAGKHSTLATPERVRLNETDPDPSLAALYFQYGRYLMVSGSRPDSPLPLNLQGIWAEQYRLPWEGDFHANLNVQMNYWPAEVANLSECHMPLMRFLQGMAEEGKKTAKAYYNAHGWMSCHTQNAWYYTAPKGGVRCGGATCGAWLATHIWSHYEFTGDLDFLKEYYPVMREASRFFLSPEVLVKDPKTGWLLTVPSSSPETSVVIERNGKIIGGPFCLGSTYDLQILRALLSGTAQAARILGEDAEWSKQLDAVREQLRPNQIDSNGCLMEWKDDGAQAKDLQHRHVSHLLGVYPFSEINSNTPELLQGAKMAMALRGDIVADLRHGMYTGTETWTRAIGTSLGCMNTQRACIWARLRDGDRACKLVDKSISDGAPNLLATQPPFQIDGNFGACAAIAEMLLQSHEGSIDLLPALPSDWSEGTISGLRARGGFEVDMSWKDGKLTAATIRSTTGTDCSVRYGGKTIALNIPKGESRMLDGALIMMTD